jgi:hypothetical protein
MIVIKQHGDFHNTERFLNQALKSNCTRILNQYGRQGVEALRAATPVDSGETANSWDYEIYRKGSSFTISWTNSNIVDGVPIAIIIQYGHATGNGGYVQGRDYINPAIRPIFDKIADEAWKEVTA